MRTVATAEIRLTNLKERRELTPIPFVRPFVTGKEGDYVNETLRSGKLASDGRYTKSCAKLMEDQFGIKKVLMTPSCTAALEIAALLCDIQPGDEVILPSFTFVSTANAFVLRGARPVFVDIRQDTLNLDETLIENAITPKTKAIVPVHYGSVACEMDSIQAIAKNHGLLVVEDAAQAVNATYGGRALGSIGQLGCFSFHETKNFVCGEGGALCINDPTLIERAEILREKGTNRSRFFRGQVDKYTWVDIGGSHLPSELSMAFLYGQLEEMQSIQERRRAVFDRYRELLRPLAERGCLRLPIVPETCQQNYHVFYILVDDAKTRDELLTNLRGSGIGAVFHYVPLHTSPMGQSYGYSEGDLPVTEDLHERLIRLPLYCEMAAEDQERIVEQIDEFFVATVKSKRHWDYPTSRVA